MANETVAKVSQAIRDNIQAALPDGVTVDYEYAARAAIAAIEPTEAMIRAGEDGYSPAQIFAMMMAEALR